VLRSGLATAKRFLAEGARVFIVDLHTSKAENDPELAHYVASKRVAFYEADVTKEDAVIAYNAKALATFDRVDTIVLSAGVCQNLAEWKDVSEKVYDSQFGVNVRGGTFINPPFSWAGWVPTPCYRVSMARHQARGKGHASVAHGGSRMFVRLAVIHRRLGWAAESQVYVPHCKIWIRAHQFLSAYSASKWAVRGLGQTAAAEFGPLNIRTNVTLADYIPIGV
jgi:NAD(P)-dependent dehydrogenase (short-subunit alcohol dehydrogenase family)